MFMRARYGHGGRVGYDREWRADPVRSGGGELIDQGVHLIDLAGWFLGAFTTIQGIATTCYWDMPVDDNAFLTLRTAGGQIAFLHVSCTEWKNLFSLELYGREGKIAIDGLGGSYGVERLAFYRMLPEMGPPETTIHEYLRGDRSWALEFAEFLDDLRLDREPAAGLAAARAALVVTGEVYRQSGYATLVPDPHPA
jgi:predicted dehydrogenase